MTFAFIRDVDIFGKSVPLFNLGGQKTVKTLPGAYATMILFTLMLTFSFLKL